MAPMSAASTTLTPTAKPAKASRVQRTNHGVEVELETIKASARKSIPKAIWCGAVPQQASEKNVEVRAAANAPRVAAKGVSFNCLKKVQAPNPNRNKAMGVTNFE